MRYLVTTRFLLSILFYFFINPLLASQPLLDIRLAHGSSAQGVISSYGSWVAVYNITNNLNIPITSPFYTFIPRIGVIPLRLSRLGCEGLDTLAPKASCSMAFQINKKVNGGSPVISASPALIKNLFRNYTAPPEEQLYIRVDPTLSETTLYAVPGQVDVTLQDPNAGTTKIVTVTNTGSSCASSLLVVPTFTDMNNMPTIASSCDYKTLNPGESCTISVTPNATETPTNGEILVVASDASPLSIPVNVIPVELFVSPTTLNLTPGSSQSIGITNTNFEVYANMLSLSSEPENQVTISADDCPTNLAPQEYCSIVVTAGSTVTPPGKPILLEISGSNVSNYFVDITIS